MCAYTYDFKFYYKNYIYLPDLSYVIQIKNFILTGNKLQIFGLLLRNLQIRDLLVDENRIRLLTDKDFTFYNNISFIHLEKNEIGRIDTDTFQPIRFHLRSLILSHNNITSLNGSLRNLSKLQTLNLKYNSIQVQNHS